LCVLGLLTKYGPRQVYYGDPGAGLPQLIGVSRQTGYRYLERPFPACDCARMSCSLEPEVPEARLLATGLSPAREIAALSARG